ncbi:biosynthetic peptidoglycan transglycosylase [Rhodococcus sp. IEGM 1351]|uniref:biosynthetic peptidoglycan transglycosylase n=1 Tax=Rhodococcus sp. IEGM 1351 TaxID=3047089 RepID=UPI0024B681B5|nr:biosynthetic peptidoglycan transglycosylase [Rhodococcus sp. IEGM 1351]MDI9934709.1 biosynthetic peptidoglycan transglycosylase [Rhodococcus sp. IEGM 1351]
MTLPVAFQLVVVTLIWQTPNTSSFMRREGTPVDYQFVSIDHISRHMIASAIAHEDVDYGERFLAFDVSTFIERANAYRNGEDDLGGSTIPQQLVKNMFLSPDKTWWRKGVEAYMSTDFVLTMSDARIMELYLNYAQFAPKLYGICAASWYYFNTPPWYMSAEESALLASILPLPSIVERGAGGGLYINAQINPKTAEKVRKDSLEGIPANIAFMGGWEGVAGQIGIKDSATDHVEERDDDSCSTMPTSVAERLWVEDPQFMATHDPTIAGR